jgi:ligand-binding sensor domain-containing protein
METVTTYSRKLIPQILLALVVATSCDSQDNASVTARGTAVKQPVSAIRTRPAKSVGGTPYDNVHCGLRDKAGNLWFGTTSEGVYRFDGKSLTAFTEKDGLISNRVYSILEDRSGNIWFGTEGGACSYDGKAFKPLPESGGRKSSVSCIFQDKAGGMWFGTGSGVYRYDGKAVTRFLSDAGISNPKDLKLHDVQQMIEDQAGTIWFASWNSEGACRFDGKTITNVTDTDGLLDGMVHSLLQDKSGNIWIGTRDHGVCLYDGKSFKHVTGIEGLSKSCVYSILEDKGGQIWLATEKDGVWRHDGNSFVNLTAKDGLGNNSVFCMVEDKSGGIWFGTRNLGLCRYDGKSFTEFSALGAQQ